MRLKRRAAITILTAIAVGAFGVWYFGPDREPSYQGKPISFWLDLAQPWPLLSSPPSPQEEHHNPIIEAKLAVAAIGPDALPFIAKRSSGRSPRVARAYSWIYKTLPSFVRRIFPAPKPSRAGFNLILTSSYFLAVTEKWGTNTIPMLVRLSTDRSSDVRRAAVLSLGRNSAFDHNSSLPVFERALADSDRVVRIEALRQLCQMSGTEPRIAPILMTYLGSTGTNLPNEMRFEALAAAHAAGPTTSAVNVGEVPAQSAEEIWSRAFAALSNWQRSPSDKNKKLALAAFEIAYSSRLDGPALDRSLQYFRFTEEQEISMFVPLLAGALSAQSEPVRDGAAHLLHELGFAARSAVPSIVEALNRANPPSPSYLVNTLASFGEKAEPAVPTLIRLLEQEGISGNAVFALSRIGPPAASAVPALLRKVEASEGDERLEHLGALVRLAPQTHELLPLIMGLLESSNPENRSVGAKMLGEMGIATTNTLAALQKVMLEDEWLAPRLDAVESINRLDPKNGSKLVTNVIELIGWMDAEDHVGPARMARLLGQIGQTSAPVLAELKRLLDHKEEPVKIAAAETLIELSPARKSECVAVLRKIMATSASGAMRFAAAKTLRSSSPENTGEIVTQVCHLLNTDVEFYQRHDAVRFLGEIGSGARAAVPELHAMLESHDWKLRRKAANALTKIQKGTAE